MLKDDSPNPKKVLSKTIGKGNEIWGVKFNPKKTTGVMSIKTVKIRFNLIVNSLSSS